MQDTKVVKHNALFDIEKFENRNSYDKLVSANRKPRVLGPSSTKLDFTWLEN